MAKNAMKFRGRSSSSQARRPTLRPTLEPLEDRVTPAASSARFAVLGDYGAGSTSAEADVATLVQSWNPDFVLTVGNNNSPAGAAATIDANVGQYYHDLINPYVGQYGAGATANQFWPSLGNQDWGDAYPNPNGAQAYLQYFTLPNNGRYYTFTQGPVQLFALDSDPNEPDGNSSSSLQAQWLQKQLAASTATWKIVYFNQAPYSSGAYYGSTTWMQWPFQAWGATAVISGHDHDYERLVEDSNFPYFVVGTGGATLDSFGTAVAGSQVRYSADWGALKVDASLTQLSFQFITRLGQVVDNYTLYAAPENSLPAAPTNLTAAVASTTQINLAWTDNSSNEDGFQIRRSTDGVNFTSLVAVAADVTTYSDTGLRPGSQYYYQVAAVNAAGTSDSSNLASDWVAAPAAPTNLTAATVSPGVINLTWSINSENETGFKIERSTDGVTFTQIAVVRDDVRT